MSARRLARAACLLALTATPALAAAQATPTAQEPAPAAAPVAPGPPIQKILTASAVSSEHNGRAGFWFMLAFAVQYAVASSGREALP